MITRQQVIERASHEGLVITESYCRRLERNGLIPEAEIRRPGRGAVALYPDGTDETVVQIAKLRHTMQGHRGKLDDKIRLHFWALGHDVNIRPLFEDALKHYRGLAGQIADDYMFAADKLMLERPKPKSLARINKKLGWRAAPIFSGLLLSPETDPPEWSEQARQENQGIFENAFYPLLRVLSEHEQSAGSQPMNQLYGIIPTIRQHIEPDNLEEILEDSKDEALRQAYHEAVEIADALDLVVGVAHVLKGNLKAAARREILADMLESPPAGQCLITLAWMSMKQDSRISDAYQQIMSTVRPMLGKPPAGHSYPRSTLEADTTPQKRS